LWGSPEPFCTPAAFSSSRPAARVRTVTYDPAKVTASNGHMTIMANTTGCTGSGCYTSGRVSSKGKRWSEIHAVGNAQKTVTLTELGKLLIAFPSPEAQAEVCNVVAGAGEVIVDAEHVMSGINQSFT
jgi:hypothetical protein